MVSTFVRVVHVVGESARRTISIMPAAVVGFAAQRECKSSACLIRADHLVDVTAGRGGAGGEVARGVLAREPLRRSLPPAQLGEHSAHRTRQAQRGLRHRCLRHVSPARAALALGLGGHPPALWLDDPRELTATRQGSPLGLGPDPGCVEGSCRSATSAGMLLYTDGLTEARRGMSFFGLEGVTTALRRLQRPSATEAVDALRARVAEFATNAPTDDLCLLAARFN